MYLSPWATPSLPSLQSQDFVTGQPELEYLTNHVEKSVSPENLFGDAGLQSTPERLHTSQSGWKMYPGSFERSMPSRQQNHLGQFTEKYACKPCPVSDCDSGHKAWDELALSPSQKVFSGRRNSLGAVLPSTQSLSLKNAMMAHRESERFRFHTCLQAPTAMVVDPNEAPESYLNKNQTYHLHIVDTTPPRFITETTKYRTFIRVSFQEQGQRLNANSVWRLWKDSRGLAETGKKHCELRAIEYAGHNGSQMLVGREFLDGFSVTWMINPVTGLNECTIPIRFNFLSTDFTFGKGVKGTPVRLCAKTDQMNNFKESYKPEICFCKIRVFRPHGAERKLASDSANVQKRIRKLTAQISEAAIPDGPPRKRMRGCGVAKKKGKPQALNNYEHDWSTNLARGLLAVPYSDILQNELTTLRKLQVSSLSENILSLRGGLEDDPEMHGACLKSAMTSVLFLDHFLGAVSLGFGSQKVAQHCLSGASQIPESSRWTPMPVAYFYIYYGSKNKFSVGRYYHKIYLLERTARELVLRICEKCDIEASRVFHILHTDTKKSHLEVLVDDEFVQQMTEGRDMIIKVKTVPASDGGGVESGADAQLGIWIEY